MNCSFCGTKIKKGQMFVSVGAYPSWWTIFGTRWVGPGYFGKTYHEACYLKLLKKRDLREKEQKPETPFEKSPQSEEEQPSMETSRKRLVR